MRETIFCITAIVLCVQGAATQTTKANDAHPKYSISCVAHSHNGKFIATGGILPFSWDFAFKRDAKIRDRKPGELTIWSNGNSQSPKTIRSVRLKKFVVAVAISSDDSQVVGAHWDGSISIWNLKSNKITTRNRDTSWLAQCLAISRNGEVLVDVTNYYSVTITRVRTGKKTTLPSNGNGRIYVVAVSANGNWMATGGKKIVLWSIKGAPKVQGVLTIGTVERHKPTERVLGLDLDKKGERLAFITTRRVGMWQRPARRVITKWKRETEFVRSCRLSPDAKHIVASVGQTKCQETKVKKQSVVVRSKKCWITYETRMWSCGSRKSVSILKRGSSVISFSPNGSTIALGVDTKLVVRRASK